MQVTRNGGFEAQESPDGKFVYYTDRPPGEPTGRENPVRLMRVPANGGDETTVLSDPYVSLDGCRRRHLLLLAWTTQNRFCAIGSHG